MSGRLKYWLPAAQIVLALGLLWISRAWTVAIMERIHGSVGDPPTYDFLIALSGPVALLHAYWQPRLYWWYDDFFFLITIGLLWYWVALNR
jgi:hypothetical protein